MSDRSDHEQVLASLTVEMRYINEGLRDVKDEVGEMRKVVTQLQVKTASHATIFGLLGGMITAFGSSLFKKIVGI